MTTEESENNPAAKYEHLARRAHLYLENHKGHAHEATLIEQVFGVRGKPEIWGGILAQVLGDSARFRRLPSGEWCLNSYNVASSALASLEYVVIDTETTGLHPQRHRITELAAIRLRDGVQVGTFQSLVNPHRRIPEYISKFTGITSEMTANAPGFSLLADKFLDFIGQAILVGHNIPFDIRFLDYELRRLGRPALLNETVDTISLATRLYPGWRRPNLDRLAALLDLPVENRHRAFGDANLTAQAFLQLLAQAEQQGYQTLADLRAGRSRLMVAPEPLPEPETETPTTNLFTMPSAEEIVRPARVKLQREGYRDPAASLTNRATVRARDVLSKKHLIGLPDKPGVYLMRDATDKVIYVGKAKNLRDRVGSYYSEPLGYTRKMDGLVESIERLEHIVTGSELEALLLESRLIKHYKPRYNRQLRNYEAYPFIKIDFGQRFPRVLNVRAVADDGGRYFGPFRNRQAVEATLEVIENLFPVRTCTRSFEPPPVGKRKRKQAPPCLRLSLGRCPGPCVEDQDGDEQHAAYLKIIEDVVSLLSGEKETMLDAIWARLNQAVQQRNFEKAASLRDAVAQVEKIVASQKFLAAAVEGNNVLICLPSSEVGAIEVLCIYRGRLGCQVRLILADTSATKATKLSQSWQMLEDEEAQLAATNPGWGKERGRVIGQEAVDEINIISRWLYAHPTHPAVVTVPPQPDSFFWGSLAEQLFEIANLTAPY